jgi:hypothetical protein
VLRAEFSRVGLLSVDYREPNVYGLGAKWDLYLYYQNLLMSIYGG